MTKSNIQKTAIFGTDFDLTFFATENRLNMGVFTYKLSLIVFHLFV